MRLFFVLDTALRSPLHFFLYRKGNWSLIETLEGCVCVQQCSVCKGSGKVVRRVKYRIAI